ncbi:hypothetical protein AKJ56_01175 [candidate division MSBL1 archaeon SCGC-AAA382N08]|uniref:Uncharacterized protein n=1 Tax=candidate division MSBL1 archaeon SCGC-AAA382N08 TaxID=1698285 RepID=A0A133VPV4_9EURY|nr:hypothetical protein AKJ56_01175 [candidate division MSBL1 archaeon SCGC-AAA382N08]
MSAPPVEAQQTQITLQISESWRNHEDEGRWRVSCKRHTTQRRFWEFAWDIQSMGEIPASNP